MRKSQGSGTVFANVRGDKNYEHFSAHQRALSNAIIDWKAKYKEEPPWEDIRFKGGHTTFEVVIELEEVEYHEPV